MSGRARAFGAAAGEYARARPTYPEEAVRFVMPRLPCRVADVGAGTGKLTEVLARLGCDVVAIEPDDAMRAQIGVAPALAGAAEALPLEDASVDAVVAGQAFHWFDEGSFAAEAARVVRRRGTVGVLWNELDDRIEWVAELARLVGDVAVLSQIEPRPPFVDDRFEPAELGVFSHLHRVDADLLVALVASQSHTILLAEAERTELLESVRGFARDRFGGEPFALPYVTHAWRLGRR